MHVLLTLLLFLAPVAAMAAGETLDEILACNAGKLGGEAALGAIDNLRVELDIAEPGFAVQGIYVASRDGRMRIDIFADGQRVFAEGLNEKGAWQWSPDGGVKASNALGAATLRNGVEAPGRFWTLRQLRGRGLQVEWLEPGPLARPGEWQLRLTREDGSTLDYFLSCTTCRPTREVSRRAFHPDVDPTEVPVETAFSEPFAVDGVTRLRHGESRRLDTGEWLGNTVLRSVEHNVTLPEGHFDAQ